MTLPSTAGDVIDPVTTRATYDAASGCFDDDRLGFWERYGQGTIARLGLAPGARVLDVCCGSGASALAAAHAVGATGRVIGVDLSAPLLESARRKAERGGLKNVDFRSGDMAQLGFADADFDAVVVVFGIFFAPDMVAQTRALARLVRPGGKLAITIWGPRFFEPLYTPFRHGVRARLPSIEEYRPWDRLTSEQDLCALLQRAGLRRFEVATEMGHEPLREPDDFWTIALGTGLRWSIDQLSAEDKASLRAECARRAHGVASIETNVIYGIAHL